MKFIRAIRKLWRLATCDHKNYCKSLLFPDSTELTICIHCGRALWMMDDGDRQNNPWMRCDRLEG
jgi:hypothetical protein